MTADLQKIAVVTGANTGLGFATSTGLASAGYTVVLACRSESKAKAAMDRIKGEVPAAKLDFIPLDLIDRDSIKGFAETFSGRYDYLNLLVNNAGVMGPPYTITPNKLELQFDANHIGHFLLTSLLLEKLDQSFETRIVNVSSLAATRDEANIYFDNLNFDGNYEEGLKLFGLTGMVAYCQSKFANILFTLELKDRLAAAGKNIKAIVVHPGVSNTDLSRNMPIYIRLLAPILSKFMNMSSADEGAQPSLYAALKDDVDAGDFIAPTGPEQCTGAPGKVALPDKAVDKPLAEKLWSLSEELGNTPFSIG